MTKLHWYQLAGFLAVSITVIAAAFVLNEPSITLSLGTLLVSVVSWYVGKLVGTPTTPVIAKTLEDAPTERIEQIIRSLPPDSANRVQVALSNVSSKPPPPEGNL